MGKAHLVPNIHFHLKESPVQYKFYLKQVKQYMQNIFQENRDITSHLILFVHDFINSKLIKLNLRESGNWFYLTKSFHITVKVLMESVLVMLIWSLFYTSHMSA